MRFSVLLILSTLDLSVKLIFILEINLLRLLGFNFEITLLEIIFTEEMVWYGRRYTSNVYNLRIMKW